jgi:predicted nuclease of predicted toxin-antitoxin system
MRFAVDACIPAQLIRALVALGADVTSAAGRPAIPDDVILADSMSEDRVLITSDKDFGELVFRQEKPAAGVILVRFDIVSEALAAEIAKRIAALNDAGRGAFTVLDRTTTRTRRTPE